MLIPSIPRIHITIKPSLSRRVNANSQRVTYDSRTWIKLIKKGEC